MNALEYHDDRSQADGSRQLSRHELTAADGTPEPELDTTYPED